MKTSTRQYRRKKPAELAHHPHHQVVLQGVGVSQVVGKPNRTGSDRRPTIVKRTEQRFVDALLAELSRPEGIQQLAGRMLPDTPEQVLTLLQPIHRTFYLALLEIVCDPYDNPHLQARLDPRQIENAGLVVRRRNLTTGKREGWRQKPYWDEASQQWKTLLNWLPFETESEEDLDPDPTHRRKQLSAGHPDLDRLLPDAPFPSERASLLFVASPKICQATGRTLLYGLIPVTSPEMSEAPPTPPTPETPELQQQMDAAIASMLPYYLRARYVRPDKDPDAAQDASDRARREPNGDRVLTAEQGNLLKNQEQLGSSGKSLNLFISTLQQLRVHFNAFETPALMDLLNQMTVHPHTPDAEPMGNFLQRATRILLDQEPGSIKLPTHWIAPKPAQHQRLIHLIRGNLLQRLGEMTAGEGRFEPLGQQYQLRAFVRLKRPDGCPSQIVWSDYSNPFEIAPWYADSGLPPVKVTLPNVLDPKVLAKLKPNVAFSVPPKLFNFLNRNNPKDLMEGKGSDGDDGGIAWMCAFNIPIITLCAFIVLNIFLQLFNLIFWWIFFIKICIPFPKKLFPK